MSDGDSSPFEDLGGKAPSTPGSSPPPDPEHLKGLVLHLLPKLAAWTLCFDLIKELACEALSWSLIREVSRVFGGHI